MLKWTLRAYCCVGEPGGFKWVDRVWKDSWILVKCQTAPAKADDFACEHINWRYMGCLKGKPVVHIQSTKAIPKPNTKTTQNWMCLKPRAVREGGKKNCMFQCRPNMRVADCATVWDCNCLQLIYLSVLRLILSEIHIIRNFFSSQSNKPVSSNPGHAWPCLCLCPYVARNQGRHGDKCSGTLSCCTAVFFGTMAEDLDLGFQSVQWDSRSSSACKT